MLDALFSRHSQPKLSAPAPSQDVLDVALRAAFTVPDHGCIKPAYFTICQGDGLQKLGKIFKQAAVNEDMVERTVERADAMPLRAPMLIVAACRYQDHPKVPAIEQAESVACSVYAMQLELDAQGFSSMWRTGDFAYSASVKTALGLSVSDEIVGFLYVGTAEPNNRPRNINVDLNTHVNYLV